ncbi:hypothetical protein MJM83_31155, partial [Salmonella enterica subsp. enterica serovar Montevideo]|nr:hypothetical protein [Salmonella enterica subsp. enterica serovar Montevideo]
EGDVESRQLRLADLGPLIGVDSGKDAEQSKRSEQRKGEKNVHDDAVWCNWRRSLPWVEGNTIPALAKEFATGVLTCESVHIVAE